MFKINISFTESRKTTEYSVAMDKLRWPLLGPLYKEQGSWRQLLYKGQEWRWFKPRRRLWPWEGRQKRTPTSPNPVPRLMRNQDTCPVGGDLKQSPTCSLWSPWTNLSFKQWPSEGLQDRVYERPPVTTEPWWTPLPRNTARQADLKNGLKSMLEKRAIVEIPLSTGIPGFYSPRFLVAKDLGGWHPVLNLKAFNCYVLPLHFRMETLSTLMDCIGEAAQQRRNTSEHLRDSEISETWAAYIDLKDAYFHVPVIPEHMRYHRFANCTNSKGSPSVSLRPQRYQYQYLDDWLLKNHVRALIKRQRDLTLF